MYSILQICFFINIGRDRETYQEIRPRILCSENNLVHVKKQTKKMGLWG